MHAYIRIIKIAIDTGRRAFLATMLAGATKALPSGGATKAGKGIAGALGNYASFGIPGTGMGRILGSLNNASKNMQGLAKWKHYRLQRKRGINKGTATLNTLLATKAHNMQAPIRKVKLLGKSEEGVTAFKEIMNPSFNNASRIKSNARKTIDGAYSLGRLA